MDHEQAAEAVISGIDGDFINKLGTERFFCEALGTERLNDSQRAMAEKLSTGPLFTKRAVPF